jgi:hypothetical protein
VVIGGGFWEEGSIELSCGGVPFFDGLTRSRFHPRVAVGGKADAVPRGAEADGLDLDHVPLAAGAVVGEDDIRPDAAHVLHRVFHLGRR